jgi:predicted nucleic acid-binding protein
VYLLDTNVVSELRRPRPHGSVVAWIASIDAASLVLSAVTIGEIQTGIEMTRERDTMKAIEIESWLNELIAATIVLPMDGDTFRIWAQLMHRRPGHLSEDAMVAATAIQHGLTVATRNLRDFEPFPVRLFDPFQAR